ncbi:MAG: maltose ABC transporter substrate-binding protein, partial [Bacillota bacterium]|nr:maltose ABC transporter substrate-binding protein [Bacillota bacterium]
MKKFLALLLILVLTFSLVACSSSSDSKEENTEVVVEEKIEMLPEEGATLTVWESQGPEGDYMRMIGEEFQEKYGVEVIYEEVPFTDSVTRLVQDGPAGVGADVFAMPHDRLGEAFAAGLVYPNTIGADRVNDEYLDAAKIGVTFDGTVYGYPVAIETYALFYNKDLLEEAPKSYEDIKEFAKTYNDPNDNKYALIWDVANAYFSHSFIAGDGGYVFGNGGTDKLDVGLSNEGAIAGLNEMISLKEILPLQSGDANYSVMDGLFQEGKAAAIINGPWAVQGYKDAEVNFGIAPLPVLANGDHPKSFSGVRGLYVSSFTEYPKAAQVFAQFASSDEMLLKRFETTGQIPPVKELMNEEIILNDEFVVPFLNQAQYATPMPSIPEMGTVWDPYAAALASAWNGDQTADEALTQAVETINESIATQE